LATEPLREKPSGLLLGEASSYAARAAKLHLECVG
jgi:hypothetical protein